MTPSPAEVHLMLTGKMPEANHVAFYGSGKAGFSDKSFDSDRFLAVSMLTLQRTMRSGLNSPSRVVLLVAPSHDKWIVEQLDEVSRATFNHIKKTGGTSKGRAELAKMIGLCFKMLFVGSRLLQLPEQPASWTSFGWTKEDPIPDWMREGLL